MSSNSKSDVSSLISELKTLKDNVVLGEAQRQELCAALQEASLAVESPLEAVNRIGFSPLQLAVVQVGMDLGLFTILDKSSSPMSAEKLAQATGSQPDLLIRLLRYLSSTGAIDAVAEDKYIASKTTKTLADPGLAAGVHHAYDILLPCFQVTPKFLAENKYQPPADNAHTAYQMIHNTDLPAFVHAMTTFSPERLQNLGLWMQTNKAALPQWLDTVPFEKLCANTDPEKPIFVDVGGSIGHQSVALKAKYPEIPGRIIYQDLPPVIAHGLQAPGVESMVHDFFQEQPIKGAQVYYLRNILHDYPDERCIAILKNTAAAMDEHSLIFIDEMILSTFTPYYQAAEMDLMMMVTLGGAERTDQQWESLVDAAGLKIKEIFTYDKLLRQSVLVLVRK